jgi:hypothetical protein
MGLSGTSKDVPFQSGGFISNLGTAKAAPFQSGGFISSLLRRF